MFESEYPISQPLSATGGVALGKELEQIFQSVEQFGLGLFRWLGLLVAYILILIGQWLRKHCSKQPVDAQAKSYPILL